MIGLFSLFGVAGALGAQFAGRLADRGWAHAAVGVFLALTALSFVALGLGATSLVALAVGLVVFDLGVQGTHISNQTIVYALRPAARSRLNSAYMTVYFLGGATGSGLSALLYASHGWAGVCLVGAAFPTVGLLLWVLDTARRRSRGAAGRDRRPSRPAERSARPGAQPLLGEPRLGGQQVAHLLDHRLLDPAADAAARSPSRPPAPRTRCPPGRRAAASGRPRSPARPGPARRPSRRSGPGRPA